MLERESEGDTPSRTLVCGRRSVCYTIEDVRRTPDHESARNGADLEACTSNEVMWTTKGQCFCRINAGRSFSLPLSLSFFLSICAFINACVCVCLSNCTALPHWRGRMEQQRHKPDGREANLCVLALASFVAFVVLRLSALRHARILCAGVCVGRGGGKVRHAPRPLLKSCVVTNADAWHTLHKIRTRSGTTDTRGPRWRGKREGDGRVCGDESNKKKNNAHARTLQINTKIAEKV